MQPAILSLGRCSHWVSPTLTEEEKDAKLAELADKDPEIERLRGISEEKCFNFIFNLKAPYPKEKEEDEDALNWIIREVYIFSI